MIIASGPAQKFVVVEAAVVISAVLIVLQTHVNFERDKRGKWSVKVEKKATDATLLRELVKKLLAFSG
jgi:preprotein translocase subunit SecF